MTCYWDGIISTLHDQDFSLFNETKPCNIVNLIEFLKRNNRRTENVYWNQSKLIEKQLSENVEHVKDYNIGGIGCGYDCSVCDPFLLLVSELFNLNIQHNYNGYVMNYSVDNPRRIVRYQSDCGHFWAS